MQSLETPCDRRALLFRHQQRTGDGGALHLHRGAARRRRQDQFRIGEIRAEQAQPPRIDFDPAQRQRGIAALAGHHADPVQRIQPLHPSVDHQSVHRRRLGLTAAQPHAHPGLLRRAAAAQRQQVAEFHRDFAALHRQVHLDRRCQRLRRRLAHRFRQVDRGADQVRAQLQPGRRRASRCAVRDRHRHRPRRTPVHVRLQPFQVAGLVEQVVDPDVRLQFGFECLLRIAHMRRAGAQREQAGCAVVLHLQAFGNEPVVVVPGLAAHVGEGELPALLAHRRAGQVDSALHAQLWSAFVVERQQHVEVGLGRPRHLQVVHHLAMFLVQRALPQHREERPGIAGGIRIHAQFRAAEARDAGLERTDRHPAQAPRASDGEAIGLEADVAVDLFHRRPVRLELELAAVHPRIDAELARTRATRLAAERPVVEVAGDHRVDVAQGPALQRGIQPLHGRLRHQVVDPEAVRRRHPRIANVGGDVEVRQAAVVGEADAAARLRIQVLAGDGQARGAHGPAGAIAPEHGLAIEGEFVDHAETRRPVERDLRLRIETQAQAVGIAQQVAVHAAHARRGADRREMQSAHARAGVQRSATRAAHVDILQHRAGGGIVQPAAQVRRCGIGQREQRQQRRGIDALRAQPELPAADHGQPIQHLFAFALADAQARGIGAPLPHAAAPARIQLQLPQHLGGRSLAGLHRRAAQGHIAQRRIGMQGDHATAIEFAPGLHAPATGGRGDARQRELAGHFAQVGLAGAGIGAAVAGLAVEIQRDGERRGAIAQPGVGTAADARAIDAHAQVDARQAGVDVQLRCQHAQARMRDLQFAEALEGGERIAALLLLAGQSAHAPAAGGIALQGQVEAAHAQLGEGAAGQQARVLRDQDFGIADAQRVGIVADAQVVKPQQRAAPGPFGFDMVEGDLALRARAQPVGDLLRMPLRQRQQLAADTVADREQHQQRGQRIPRTAAAQAQATAQRGGHLENHIIRATVGLHPHQSSTTSNCSCRYCASAWKRIDLPRNSSSSATALDSSSVMRPTTFGEAITSSRAASNWRTARTISRKIS